MQLSRVFRIVKNHILLWLSFELENKRGKKNVSVYTFRGQQIKSNKRRNKDYSFDDIGWRIK